MSDAKVISIFALGQAEDGKVYIKKPMEEILSIDTDVDIVVLEGVNVRLYDTTQNKKINVFVAKDAVVSYYVTNSENSERSFTIEGELHMVSISVNHTEEKLTVELTREQATADIKNLSVVVGVPSRYEQKAIHRIGSTFSNIQNVGVAIDGANLVFDTTGKIEKGMTKSKCSQLSRGIVMDDSSAITAKPILLIDEFDCFANHGASIGKMSDEDLFYLMSRGLTKKEAFLLILQGIIRPYVDSFPMENVREAITTDIQNRIGE